MSSCHCLQLLLWQLASNVVNPGIIEVPTQKLVYWRYCWGGLVYNNEAKLCDQNYLKIDYDLQKERRSTPRNRECVVYICAIRQSAIRTINCATNMNVKGGKVERKVDGDYWDMFCAIECSV